MWNDLQLHLCHELGPPVYATVTMPRDGLSARETVQLDTPLIPSCWPSLLVWFLPPFRYKSIEQCPLNHNLDLDDDGRRSISCWSLCLSGDHPVPTWTDRRTQQRPQHVEEKRISFIEITKCCHHGEMHCEQLLLLLQHSVTLCKDKKYRQQRRIRETAIADWPIQKSTYSQSSKVTDNWMETEERS